METPIEALRRVSEKHEMTPEDQLQLLQSAPDISDPVAYVEHVKCLDDMLSSLSADAATERFPENQLNELMHMFDRNLSLSELAPLKEVPPTFLDDDGFEMLLTIDEATFFNYHSLLIDTEWEHDVPPGHTLAGWYGKFADGAVGVIIVANGGIGAGASYVDAFIILPNGMFPASPNPSLPPVEALDKPFVFDYPDGTKRTITIEPYIR